MAYADYRLCDVCECKAFYDANLNYDHNVDKDEYIRNSYVSLDNVGDWSVICRDCAKKYKTVVVEI